MIFGSRELSPEVRELIAQVRRTLDLVEKLAYAWLLSGKSGGGGDNVFAKLLGGIGEGMARSKTGGDQ